MALLTNRKFIHFNQKSSFDTALANEQIANWQIVFIKDARLIWTHGLYYSFDQRITNDIYHKLLALNEINVELVSQVDALQQTVYNFFLSGATANRPDDMELGIAFFDTDLDKPIWWDGTKWIDSEGNPAGARHSGTTAQRPTGVKAGFMYYDTTIGKVLNYNGTSWIETGLTETEVENIVKYNSKEVEEYNGTSSFPPTGEDGIVYVDTSTTPPTYYTWNGTTYVPNSNALNQVDWNESDTTSSQYIKNKPTSLPASDVYSWAKAATKPSYNYSEIGNTPTLGTAAAKDVPTSGNASTTQVVMGNDTRLTDSRSASDVYSWAKAENKPTYTKSEVGLSDVTNDAQVKRSEMGVANGVATLDANGKVPSSQLPSYVDDVVEGYLYNGAFYEESTHETTITGESSKIYVDLTTDKSYRWGGSAYVKISSSDVTGIKIGASGSTISPSNGVITLPEYPEQLQSDWEQSTTTAKDYIKNKPTIITNQAILDLFGGSSVDPSENANVITTNDVVSTTKNGVVPKTTAAVKYLQTNAQGVASWGDLPTDTDTKYKLSVNGTLNGDSTGTDLGTVYAPSTAGTTGQYLKSTGSGAPAWENFPASLPASDVLSWAKAANKPSYGYGEITYLSNTASDYIINNSSTTLSIDGTQPLQVVTTTTNIAGITFSALPADGHSCHLLITAASALTVDIAHDATMITVESTAYKTVCPKAAAMDTLNITAGGYVELDLLRVGTKIYVRGV